MFALLPMLISAAASIGSSLISNAGAQSRQDAMNAYNTPAAQMARYTSAGLNPNLIYTQGTPGNQPGPVQFTTPDVDPIKIYSAVQAARESKQRVAESKLRSELHIANTNAMAMKNAYNALVYRAQEPYINDNAKYQSGIMKQMLAKHFATTKNLGQQFENLVKDFELKNQVLGEKTYYNKLRDYGVEKGDNPLIRMGSLLMQKFVPQYNLKLRK